MVYSKKIAAQWEGHTYNDLLNSLAKSFDDKILLETKRFITLLSLAETEVTGWNVEGLPNPLTKLGTPMTFTRLLQRETGSSK